MILIKGITWIWGAGGSFFIFIWFKSKTPKIETINHERIHFMQQLELLFVGMWVIYLLNLIFNWVKYRSLYKAYKNVIFERESNDNENDMQYLITRKPYAWTKYFNNDNK